MPAAFTWWGIPMDDDEYQKVTLEEPLTELEGRERALGDGTLENEYLLSYPAMGINNENAPGRIQER